MTEPLVSFEAALALDAEASASWGLNPFALVEAAGRASARALVDYCSAAGLPAQGRAVRALAGPGNNGADALVMLRALVMGGFAAEGSSAAILSRPAEADDPRSLAAASLLAMGVPVYVWDGANPEERSRIESLMEGADIIIDGIAGTGLRGALRGPSREMALALNALCSRGSVPAGGSRPLVAALDLPSGCQDEGLEGESTDGKAVCVVRADITLAIEPLKRSLYVPAWRPLCGAIVPVRGIFPRTLLGPYSGGAAELLDWEAAKKRIPPVPADAHKYLRGLVEIHAGDYGSCGAARIAARGTQAAGAGLVRLVVDDELYPVLAVDAGGIMVVPASKAALETGRFRPDAILLGPGWGLAENRFAVLEKALRAEEEGVPLILDADAFALVKEHFRRKNAAIRFHGRAVLTPHAGELERFTGIEKERLLSRPSLLVNLASDLNAILVFKSHVTTVIRPCAENPLAYIDGMKAALGAGGSGDLLAGFCAALAARLYREERGRGGEGGQSGLSGSADGQDEHGTRAVFSAAADGAFTARLGDCAAAASALLTAAAEKRGKSFGDPLELAAAASELAGSAWLP